MTAGEHRPEVDGAIEPGDQLDRASAISTNADEARDQQELGADQHPGSAERPPRPTHPEILRCPRAGVRAHGPLESPRRDAMAKNRGSDAQLLTMHELAVYLHLDEATVTKLVTAGKIPSLQVDRQWRFKRDRDRRVDRGAARRRRRELRRRARRHEAAARGSAPRPGDHHEPAREDAGRA